ncbi:MAG: NAD-dependent epimerase/dehydratase family protein [Myxococcota bacterium]
MAVSGDRHTVAVTGASGYIGTHVVRLLLEEGHNVHATVRDPSDDNKVAHLESLPGADRLTLFAANVLDSRSFDEAFAGCDWLVHAASSVRLSAPDPQRDIVDPAVKGTRNVLEAAERAGTVRRVVVTSSIAAVAPSEGPAGVTFTEDDWNDKADLENSPYPLAKVKAERTAWDFVEAMPEEKRLRLVTLLPGMVFGPVLARVHLRSSPSTLRLILQGKIPALPRLSFGLVDVREVALAHLRGLEKDDAKGRYLLVAGQLWMEEIARILREHFPNAPVPKRRMPTLMTYGLALFTKSMSLHFVRNNLGRERFFAATRRKELGIEFRPLEETVVDTAQSLRDQGFDRAGRGKR